LPEWAAAYVCMAVELAETSIREATALRERRLHEMRRVLGAPTAEFVVTPDGAVWLSFPETIPDARPVEDDPAGPSDQSDGGA
jgi:hypothetical protein